MPIRPDLIDAHRDQGVAFMQQGRLQEALASFDRLLAIRPDQVDALINRGICLAGLGRRAEALASFDSALAVEPGNAGVLLNRGVVLAELNRPQDALASYAKALAIQPANPLAHFNRGVALNALARLDEALACFDRALAIEPRYVQAHINRGATLKLLDRPAEALASYDKALALQPDNVDALVNRGDVLGDLNRCEAATASYDHAIALRPDHAEAQSNRGRALQRLGRLDEAVAGYERAIALKSDYAEAHDNLGGAYREMGRFDKAAACFKAALTLKPDLDYALGDHLYCRMQICDWTGFADDLWRLRDGVLQGRKVTAPLVALGLIDDPAIHRRAAGIYAEDLFPRRGAATTFPARKAGHKIRVGYYSSDFNNHATSYLAAQLFEAHDRGRFELYGFAFGPDRQDEMRARVSAAFDRFFAVDGYSDRKVVELSRDLGIDIAVDLNGYTRNSRTGVFAAGCAPVQASYLGYPGTMAAGFIDYILADETVIPPHGLAHFSEKVVYLPGCYQANDARRPISDRPLTRADAGLPEDGFVYCCFNNSWKILPDMFDGWMRVVRAVDGSVLWLLDSNPAARRNLRREAEARGVDGRRLVFAQYAALDEHLARHRLADLFLDTLPYNAHTTASDALWAGLPVLTRIGEAFAGRVAASLLCTLGLEELIARTQEEYEAKAITLAAEPHELSRIRQALEASRTSSSLFDGERLARRIEVAYLEMQARREAGLPPAGFTVSD